jgi:hypothetical protein
MSRVNQDPHLCGQYRGVAHRVRGRGAQLGRCGGGLDGSFKLTCLDQARANRHSARA